jgi:phosphopantetheinyl transferase
VSDLCCSLILSPTCAPVALQDLASRSALFMALWTLKESVVKAKGSGISAAPGLKGFSIRECTSRTRTHSLV